MNDPFVTREYRLLIGGSLVEGASTFDVVNPATAGVLAACPCATRLQLDQAIAAAHTAFGPWAATALEERRKLLLRLADALHGEGEAMARLLTLEQGKPLAQARRELARSVDTIRELAALNLPIEVLKEGPTDRIVRQYLPLGVVAAITPWNSPILLLVVKVAPALLAGNTVVIKPAPTTPLTTLRFGELCAQIFSPGVVNVITGQNDLGDHITRHPQVAKVAFTGSTATGRKVMAAVADTLKRLTVELGGNDAAIVLDDVDPHEVAPKIFNGAMVNCGQVCFAIKRVYAHHSIYDPLCNELARLADQAIVDDGAKEGTQIGPVQNAVQFERLKRLLEATRGHGRIIAGGAPIDRPGFFIRPTIVRDIADDTPLVQEEQFGPILPVLSYVDLDEVIDRVNAGQYGLGATVWSADAQRAEAVALKLQTGIVWINKHLDLPTNVAVGGAKQSGFGSEMGDEGLREFTQSKIINIKLSPTPSARTQK
jgi:acyl-CoA reductase-like NAD-dependent aldehyde dehydrogenase